MASVYFRAVVAVAATGIGMFTGISIPGTDDLCKYFDELRGAPDDETRLKKQLEAAAERLRARLGGGYDETTVDIAVELLDGLSIDPDQVLREAFMAPGTQPEQGMVALLRDLQPVHVRDHYGAAKVGKAWELVEVAHAALIQDETYWQNNIRFFCQQVLTALTPGTKPRLTMPDENITVPRAAYLFTATEAEGSVRLLGRDTELEQLEAFVLGPKESALSQKADRRVERLRDTGGIEWMQIAGEGGQGKSRLALELCRRLPPGIAVGFLEKNELENFTRWSEWRPSMPTLIVIDYVSGYEEHIRRLLADRKDMDGNPVRLLLLERQAWSRPNISAGDGMDEGGVADWFKRLNDGSQLRAGMAASLRHEDHVAEGVISLTALESGALAGIVEQRLKLLGSGGPAPARGEITENLGRIDAEGRPLYAYFLAEALADGKDTSAWTKVALLDDVLDRERGRWWLPRDNPSRIDADSAELNIAILATITEFANPAALADSLGPRAGSWTNEAIERAGSITGTGIVETAGGRNVGALRPDILGERFVLRALEGALPLIRRRRADLIHAAWKFAPLATANFVQKALRDFGSDQTLHAFLEAGLPDDDDAHFAAAAVFVMLTYNALSFPSVFLPLVRLATSVRLRFPDNAAIGLCVATGAFTAAHAFGKIGEWELLEAAREVLRETALHFSDDAEIARQVTMAAYNAAHGFGGAEEWERLDSAREELRETASRFPDNAEIALHVAMGAYNASNSYRGAGNVDLAERAREELRQTASCFPESAEIALPVAMGAANAARAFGDAQEWERLEAALEELHETASRFSGNAEIALQVAIGATNATHAFGKAGRLARLEAVREELRETASRFSDDAEIALHVAMAAYNAAHVFGAAQEWERLEAALEELRETASHFPDNAEIALNMAKGAYNASNSFRGAGKVDLAESAREEIRQAASRFSDNAEIALQVAKGAYNAAVGFGAAQDWSRLEAAVNELHTIAAQYESDLEIHTHYARGLLLLAYELRSQDPDADISGICMELQPLRGLLSGDENMMETAEKLCGPGPIAPSI